MKTLLYVLAAVIALAVTRVNSLRADDVWEDIKNETWTVVSKTAEYLILASVESDPATIRTITINPQYGTFVQCFNGHQAWAGANLGTVSWGYCTNQ